MSQESVTDNKRIAKNAVALYLRSIVTMLIGLYTSRVILQALGVEDYGIYNVVGGFVSMFSLISGSLSGSISRYLTFELGRGDTANLRRVFSTSIYVLIGLSVIVIIATETIGLWYLYHKMVIPEERMTAAFWVFQISVFTFVLSLINTPYSASIASHERMDIYAYLSIFDAVCKLIICYLVMCSPIDRLVYYALLLCAISIIDQCIYVWFCKRHFEECHFKMVFDKSLFKGMFGFAGWNFIGSSASILRGQGISLLFNAFGGPVVNAANGIANTIAGVVYAFVGNLTQAFTPQITKRYAAGEYKSLMQLLIYGSKYSYYMLFILALPIMLNTNFVFHLWLGIVPEHTVAFSRCAFICALADSISRPIINAKNATGRIRNYQIIVGGIVLSLLPISYICLKLGAPVEAVTIADAIIAIIAFFARMYLLKGDFPFWSSWYFLNKVFFNVLMVSTVSTILPLMLFCYLEDGWICFVSTTILSITCTSLAIYYIGCNPIERTLIISKARDLKQNIKVKLR